MSQSRRHSRPSRILGTRLKAWRSLMNWTAPGRWEPRSL